MLGKGPYVYNKPVLTVGRKQRSPVSKLDTFNIISTNQSKVLWDQYTVVQLLQTTKIYVWPNKHCFLYTFLYGKVLLSLTVPFVMKRRWRFVQQLFIMINMQFYAYAKSKWCNYTIGNEIEFYINLKIKALSILCSKVFQQISHLLSLNEAKCKINCSHVNSDLSLQWLPMKMRMYWC